MAITTSTVEFACNGDTASGYLAPPDGRARARVIVIQEWWGLNPQIKRTADRLAEAGFVALAPDLYHGELAGHDEMDKAGQLMSSLPPERAAKDMGGAVDHLAGLAVGDRRRHRRDRLLHGRHAVVPARRPEARQDQGRGAVLRLPAGRRRARLVHARRPRCAATCPTPTTTSPPPRPRPSRPSCRAWARTSRSPSTPPATGSWVRTTPWAPRREAGGEVLARGVGFLHDQLD